MMLWYQIFSDLFISPPINYLLTKVLQHEFVFPCFSQHLLTVTKFAGLGEQRLCILSSGVRHGKREGSIFRNGYTTLRELGSIRSDNGPAYLRSRTRHELTLWRTARPSLKHTHNSLRLS